jgi:hypothetical protein
LSARSRRVRAVPFSRAGRGADRLTRLAGKICSLL